MFMSSIYCFQYTLHHRLYLYCIRKIYGCDVIPKLIDKLQITRKVLFIIVFQITKIEELNMSRLLYFSMNLFIHIYSIYLFTFTLFLKNKI